MVRWLHDIFDRRGYDTFAKVTGNRPVTIYNGTSRDISRPAQVRLYENERVLADVGNVDVLIVENQGIRQYTTRLVNQEFVKPHAVFLTNIRLDHQDTLGRTRRHVARSLIRAIPSDTAVVSGEQDATVREYIQAELGRRGIEPQHVDVPSTHAGIPGAEMVFGLTPLLSAVNHFPIPGAEVATKLEELTVQWKQLPGGRAFNAAPANDVQSTELIRTHLVRDTGEVVEPVLNLRADRRGRTASFVRYFDRLYESGDVERVRLLGDDQRLFERNASVPVVRHDRGSTTPSTVLDRALATGRPVFIVGNVVDEFVQALAAEIEEQAIRDDDELHTPVPEWPTNGTRGGQTHRD